MGFNLFGALKEKSIFGGQPWSTTLPLPYLVYLHFSAAVEKRKKKLEGCIGCYQEKCNEKVYNMHTIMVILNLDQDVANRGERKQTGAHIVAKS